MMAEPYVRMSKESPIASSSYWVRIGTRKDSLAVVINAGRSTLPFVGLRSTTLNIFRLVLAVGTFVVAWRTTPELLSEFPVTKSTHLFVLAPKSLRILGKSGRVQLGSFRGTQVRTTILRRANANIETPWETAGEALRNAGIDMRAAADMLGKIDGARKDAISDLVSKAVDLDAAHKDAIAGAVSAHNEAIVGAAEANDKAIAAFVSTARELDMAHKEALYAAASAHNQAIAGAAAAHDKAISGLAGRASQQAGAHRKAIAHATEAHDKAMAKLANTAKGLDAVGRSLVHAGWLMQLGPEALDSTAKALLAAGMAAHNTAIADAAEGLISAATDLSDATVVLCSPGETCCVPNGWRTFANAAVSEDAAAALGSAADALSSVAKTEALTIVAGTPADDAILRLVTAASALSYASAMLKYVEVSTPSCSAGVH